MSLNSGQIVKSASENDLHDGKKSAHQESSSASKIIHLEIANAKLNTKWLLKISYFSDFWVQKVDFKQFQAISGNFREIFTKPPF